MLKNQLAVFEVLRNIMVGKQTEICKVEFHPQKPPFPKEQPQEQSLPESTPEEQGVSSVLIEKFLRELKGLKTTDIHNVIILRNGKVIARCGYGPYSTKVWHITHSMCKSITGMAIGMLIAEEKITLDDKVGKFFKKPGLLTLGAGLKNVTIRHLLTMTSQVPFNETGVITGNDWVLNYLEEMIGAAQGEEFNYNSMNTYMLSAVVTAVTGESMMDYLRPRLWEPLGITRIFWESCPMGITKGGWGLFLCPEDAAKLGQLYLQKGKWNGQQIVPREWVEESTARQLQVPEKMGFGYGYQIWTGDRPGSFLFNGMLGQNVVVYPDINMVFVTNGGSDEFYPNCELIRTLSRYFGLGYEPEEILRPSKGDYRRLQTTIENLERGDFQPGMMAGGWKRKGCPIRGKVDGRKILDKLVGNTYEITPGHVGLFPLIMQVFHNNFSEGIREMTFIKEEGRYFLDVLEGTESIRLELGLERPVENELTIHGESYLVGVCGTFGVNEDGLEVVKLDIAYLEEAVHRHIRICNQGDTLEIQWNEAPGKTIIMDGLKGLIQDAGNNAFVANLTGAGEVDIPTVLMERTVAPVTVGRKVEKA